MTEAVNMKNLFGFCQINDWCNNVSISAIMQIVPIALQDILSTNNNELELTRESLVEKITLTLIAYFCISTEKRFFAQNNKSEKQLYEKQAEHWHSKALELGCSFLPAESPLLGHIYSSYQKHYSVMQRMIVISCCIISRKT